MQTMWPNPSIPWPTLLAKRMASSKRFSSNSCTASTRVDIDKRLVGNKSVVFPCVPLLSKAHIPTCLAPWCPLAIGMSWRHFGYLGSVIWEKKSTKPRWAPRVTSSQCDDSCSRNQMGKSRALGRPKNPAAQWDTWEVVVLQRPSAYGCGRLLRFNIQESIHRNTLGLWISMGAESGSIKGRVRVLEIWAPPLHGKGRHWCCKISSMSASQGWIEFQRNTTSETSLLNSV